MWWDGPGQQPSTHGAVCSLFPFFLSHSGNGKKIRRTRTRKLVDQNNDKEITRQLLQLAKQTQLGEFHLKHLKHLNSDLGIGKQRWQTFKDLEKTPFLSHSQVLLHPSHFFSPLPNLHSPSFYCRLHSVPSVRPQVVQEVGVSVQLFLSAALFPFSSIAPSFLLFPLLQCGLLRGPHSLQRGTCGSAGLSMSGSPFMEVSDPAWVLHGQQSFPEVLALPRAYPLATVFSGKHLIEYRSSIYHSSFRSITSSTVECLLMLWPCSLCHSLVPPPLEFSAFLKVCPHRGTSHSSDLLSFGMQQIHCWAGLNQLCLA